MQNDSIPFETSEALSEILKEVQLSSSAERIIYALELYYTRYQGHRQSEQRQIRQEILDALEEALQVLLSEEGKKKLCDLLTPTEFDDAKQDVNTHTSEKIKKACEILQVKDLSNKEEVKTQFRLLALKHHPDRGGDKETMRRIIENYQILMLSDYIPPYLSKGTVIEQNEIIAPLLVEVVKIYGGVLREDFQFTKAIKIYETYFNYEDALVKRDLIKAKLRMKKAYEEFLKRDGSVPEWMKNMDFTNFKKYIEERFTFRVTEEDIKIKRLNFREPIIEAIAWCYRDLGNFDKGINLLEELENERRNLPPKRRYEVLGDFFKYSLKSMKKLKRVGFPFPYYRPNAHYAKREIENMTKEGIISGTVKEEMLEKINKRENKQIEKQIKIEEEKRAIMKWHERQRQKAPKDYLFIKLTERLPDEPVGLKKVLIPPEPPWGYPIFSPTIREFFSNVTGTTESDLIVPAYDPNILYSRLTPQQRWVYHQWLEKPHNEINQNYVFLRYFQLFEALTKLRKVNNEVKIKIQNELRFLIDIFVHNTYLFSKGLDILRISFLKPENIEKLYERIEIAEADWTKFCDGYYSIYATPGRYEEKSVLGPLGELYRSGVIFIKDSEIDKQVESFVQEIQRRHSDKPLVKQRFSYRKKQKEPELGPKDLMAFSYTNKSVPQDPYPKVSLGMRGAGLIVKAFQANNEIHLIPMDQQIEYIKIGCEDFFSYDALVYLTMLVERGLVKQKGKGIFVLTPETIQKIQKVIKKQAWGVFYS